MLNRVVLVRTDVSEELRASSIMVIRIGDLGTTVAVTSLLSSSETSVLTIATRCNIPEDGILHSHRRENLKSFMIYCCLHLQGRQYHPARNNINKCITM
jgi:hypothetical protein